MKKSLSVIAMLAAVVTGVVSLEGRAEAQELSNFNFSGARKIVSPEINSDKTTFRLQANYATIVNLVGAWMDNPWGPGVPMTKGNDGVWELTIDTPSPEIYFYSFIVDGVVMGDPLNVMVQRDGTRYLSMLIVPGERTENYYEAKRHGTVSYRWYNSPILGIDRRLTVYTPYGYEDSANRNRKYPVLYLLHGAGGDEEAWTSMGRAAQILDNLIEKGQAVPMIVVMPNGNPGQMAAKTLGLPESELDWRVLENRTRYVSSLCEEIVPFIEKNYRVAAKPSSRAIAGLSMGGGHTIAASLMYPEMFDYICPLSAAGEATPEQVAALKKAGVKLYFLACGTTDFLYDTSVKLDAVLTEQGLDHVFYKSDGGHVWSNWRLYLNTFAPMLFK
ncbi:MAG: esterase [Bacteroidales bacterium]|nr:esterase [Bacteroidales bacterium]